MLAKVRPRLTYANVVSSVCLFIALGGTSYAVATGSIDSREIKNNTIRSKDIRNNQVRSRDVRNASLLAEDFAPRQLPAGPRGAQGPQGARGLPGAPGQPGTSVFAGAIPSGTMIRGVFGASSRANDSDGSAFTVGAVSFPVPAPAELSEDDVSFPPSAQANNADEDTACTGSSSAPTAPAGKVCLYVDGFTGAADSASADPVQTGPASRFGFAFAVGGNTADPSQAGIEGTWAYTAP